MVVTQIDTEEAGGGGDVYTLVFSVGYVAVYHVVPVRKG
jgi:hypothetical protein